MIRETKLKPKFSAFNINFVSTITYLKALIKVLIQGYRLRLTEQHSFCLTVNSLENIFVYFKQVLLLSNEL